MELRVKACEEEEEEDKVKGYCHLTEYFGCLDLVMFSLGVNFLMITLSHSRLVRKIVFPPPSLSSRLGQCCNVAR